MRLCDKKVGERTALTDYVVAQGQQSEAKCPQSSQAFCRGRVYRKCIESRRPFRHTPCIFPRVLRILLLLPKLIEAAAVRLGVFGARRLAGLLVRLTGLRLTPSSHAREEKQITNQNANPQHKIKPAILVPNHSENQLMQHYERHSRRTSKPVG